jgi:DNA-binding transcriptional LysR family regulator
VRRLEEILGVELFSRSSRHVVVTTAGEQLLSYAHRLLRLNDEAVGVMGRDSLEGRLRLGVVEYLLPHRLPEFLVRIRRALPRVELSVKVALSEALLHDFERGELDVIVVKHQEGHGSPQLFREERLVWVSSQHSDSPSTLVELCLLSGPCAFRTAATSVLNLSGYRWREAFTLSSIVGIQACVLQGLGVSVLCESALVPGLVVLPEGDGAWPALPGIRLVTYEQNSNPLSRRLLDLLRELDLTS